MNDSTTSMQSPSYTISWSHVWYNFIGSALSLSTSGRTQVPTSKYSARILGRRPKFQFLKMTAAAWCKRLIRPFLHLCCTMSSDMLRCTTCTSAPIVTAVTRNLPPPQFLGMLLMSSRCIKCSWSIDGFHALRCRSTMPQQTVWMRHVIQQDAGGVRIKILGLLWRACRIEKAWLRLRQVHFWR